MKANLSIVLKWFNTLSASLKAVWLAIILLGILYLRLAYSFENRTSAIEREVYSQTALSGGFTRIDVIVAKLEKLENTVGGIKSETCSGLSRLFELNGKVYICPLEFR